MKAKLFIKLDVTDGYPPVAEESLWSTQVTETTYEIDNIPFYAKDLSLGDVVSVKKNNDNLHVDQVMQSSGNSTIRVIFFNSEEQALEITHQLIKMDCEIETFSKQFIALSISKTDILERVITYLDLLSSEEKLDYEVGKICIW